MGHDYTYEEALERLTEAEENISEDEYNGVRVGADFPSRLHLLTTVGVL